MPAIAPISINDGAATPVAHVFSPVTTNGSTAKWANRVAAIPNAYERLQIQLLEPTSPTAAYRMIGSLTRPILGTVDGVQVVVRQEKVDFTLNFSQTSSEQERKDDVTLIKNLFSDSTFMTAATKLEPYY